MNPGIKSRTGALFDEAARSAPDKFLQAYIDGGARGNPGPAGYGVLLQDHSGRRVAALSEYLGHQTNNFAEYSGLIASLDYALAHDWRALKVISDSELMVRQIRGIYKVKSPALQELYAKAKQLIHKLDWFEIQHVLREKNREADRLANEAMDRGHGKQIQSQSGSKVSKTTASQELNGIVRGGMIELLSGELPEGTLVKVRIKE